MGGCSRSELHFYFPTLVPLKYEITNDDIDCLSSAHNLRPYFIVSEEEAEEMWKRAIYFVSKVTVNKLVLFNNHSITSEGHAMKGKYLDYLITKYSVGDGKVMIEVNCISDEVWAKKKAQQNQAIAVQYILTGILCNSEIIYK